MKTRTALVYLAVFVVLGAYFYYFEVVRHKSRTEQEEAALHLFRIDKDTITTVLLDKGQPKPISIKRNSHWHIVGPINSPADELAVESLLTSLTSLKMEREVKNNAEDLQPYGLEKPQLKVSFSANSSRHHLRIGAKTVVGNQYYASVDQENRVVLIGASQQQSLNKSLFDLRRKELFTFEKDEVKTIAVESAEVEMTLKKLDGERWQSQTKPDARIKSSKVDTLLGRLVWLQAKRFLDNPVDPVTQLGLAPARIRISLSNKERTETLLLGDSTKDQSVYAKGDGLTGIALVEDKLLEQLPTSLTDLEDRTLFLFNLDDVENLELQLDNRTYRLERHEEKWIWTDEQSRNDPENWRVNSLLWKLQELEYLPGDAPEVRIPPEDPQLKLQLLSGDEKLGTFLLAEVPDEKGARETMWFGKGSEPTQPYWLSSESLSAVYEDVEKLLTSEAQESKG